MKLALYSDIHLEYGDWQPPQDQADVIILAGDIGEPPQVIKWIKKHYQKPVIYIPGNHEYYNGDYDRVNQYLRDQADSINHLHILQNDELILDGVRFLGCTLWSSFDLYESKPLPGDHPTRPYQPNSRGEYGRIAAQGLNDFNCISVAGKTMTPEAMAQLNETSANWLTEHLQQTFDGKTVVVTHFLPSLKSCPERFLQHPWVPYFIANCEHLISEYQPDLWLHGHSHQCVDYRIGDTRIIANQLGYAWERNHDFQDQLLIRVGD